jgi:hypothetical protein
LYIVQYEVYVILLLQWKSGAYRDHDDILRIPAEERRYYREPGNRD